MSNELLRYLYHRLLHSDSAKLGCDAHYSDGLIAFMFLYAALSDRSPHWAVNKKVWPLWCQRLKFPSYSQFNRRLKTAAVQKVIQMVNSECREKLPHSQEKFLDGKPEVVGGYSKDPDARGGHIPDGWGKGYKVHVFADKTGAIDAFEVTALDAGEPTVARRLIENIDLKGVVVRADNNYDSNKLYKDVADRGGRLIAPRKKPGKGIGHHPQHPDRLRAIRELEGDSSIMKDHCRQRASVERTLALLTNLPFGLAPLPNFVRRLQRVKRWVAAKITLYHLYCSLSLEKRLAA